MNLNKIKNIVKILLFAIIVINIGITLNILLNGPKDVQESKPVNDAPLKGIGLFVANENDDNNVHNQILDYSNINNYSYKFTNATGKDLNCTLSVFLNGTQVKLINTDDNTIINNYTFSINNGEEKIMPLKLNLENLDMGSYQLTFNLVTDPEDNAINREEVVWTNSSYNYVLGLYNADTKIVIPEQTTLSIDTTNSINDIDCSQFIINYTKDEFNSEAICKNYIESPMCSW